jgi:CP family cyanate transporter-like MFS transporter
MMGFGRAGLLSRAIDPAYLDRVSVGSIRQEGSQLPRSAATALVALFLASLVLRPQLLAIGPLLPAIRSDLGLSHGVAGLLGTIPVLCMGLFAPLGPRLVARLGVRVGLAACLAAIGLFGLARSIAPDAVLVLTATFGLGIAIGSAGAIPAGFVKIRIPARPALGTAVYAAGIVGGAVLGAAVAVPLAAPDGDWRRSLALISLATLVPLAAWLMLIEPDRAGERPDAGPPHLPWRSSTGWLLAVVFGLQSMIYYGLVSWLPNAFVERGWSDASAGQLAALMSVASLVAILGVPLVADRLGTRRSQLLVVSAGVLAGLLGVILVPEMAPTWAVILGASLGAIFSLVLVLPVDVADSAGDVGAVAALMLLGGYTMASTSPVLLGVVRDVTGSFVASLWTMVLLAGGLLVSCLWLSPRRLRRGVSRTAVLAPSD